MLAAENHQATTTYHAGKKFVIGRCHPMRLPSTTMTNYHLTRRRRNRRVEFASHFPVVGYFSTGKRA